MNIFKEEIRIFSIREIYSFTFNDFKTKGYPLNNEYQETILKYYKKVYKNEFIIPFYHCLPTFNTLTNDGKFKFLIAQRGDDTILLVYKVIQILKTKQIRFFDIPISLNCIEENQYELIYDLLKIDFVRFCYSSPFTDWFNTAYCDRYPEYDNYCKSRDWYDNVCNKSWQRVRGVYDVLHNDDFKIVVSNFIFLNEAKCIRENFNEYIEQRGGKVSRTDDNEFYNIIKNAKYNDKIVYVALYYKNEIIGLRVLFVIRELGVAYGLYNIHVRHEVYKDKIVEKALKFGFV